MPKINIVNKETGERSFIEKKTYFQRVRRQGLYVLEEEYVEPVVEEVKRGPGRPKKVSS